MKVSVETPFTVSANILKLAAPRGMSRWRARLGGLPVSRHSAARKSSSRALMPSATLARMSVRSATVILPQGPWRAALAARQAASISALPPSGTRPMRLLSSGVRFSQLLPVEPSVNAPSMKWAASRRALSKLADAFLRAWIVILYPSSTAPLASGNRGQSRGAGFCTFAVVVFRAARDSHSANDDAVLDDRETASEQHDAGSNRDAVVQHRIALERI